jgi:Mg2+ and Co2+ transporter CorA
MRHRRVLLAAISILTFVSHAGAQNAKPALDVVVVPFVVETDKVDTLRAQANSCSDDLVAALAVKGVAVTRNPTLSEKNLQSTSALWAVLGRITREKEQFQLELRLLEVKSGEELRSYFNADKDLKVACRAVDKAAERIAAFVVEQKRAQQ